MWWEVKGKLEGWEGSMVMREEPGVIRADSGSTVDKHNTVHFGEHCSVLVPVRTSHFFPNI